MAPRLSSDGRGVPQGEGSVVAELIITLGAVGAVILAVLRWAWPKVKTFSRAVGEFKDAVLGREATVHPDTGAELVPAQPGLGARMASIEIAVGELARTHRRLDSHEARIAALEQAATERAMARTETIEMLRVVDTALRTDPPEDQ